LTFNVLKREEGKVNTLKVDLAQNRWQQDKLTKSELKYERERADVWNWGQVIMYSTDSDNPSSSSNESTSANHHQPIVLDDPVTQSNPIITPSAFQSMPVTSNGSDTGPASIPPTTLATSVVPTNATPAESLADEPFPTQLVVGAPNSPTTNTNVNTPIVPAVSNTETQTETFAATSHSADDTSASEIVTVKSSADYFKAKSLLLIDYSLYADLENCLYSNRLLPEEESPLYLELRKMARRFITLMILRMEELGDVIAYRPISHIFADIKACVDFLRNTVALDWEKQIDDTEEHLTLIGQREKFWKELLTEVGMFHIAEGSES
jgi:hypothetical protein